MPFRDDDVTVKVGSDTYDLERGMVRGRRSVKGFDRDVSGMAVTVARVGAGAALALGGIAVAAAGLARQAAGAAKEIRNLADISGTSAESFQRQAVAARTVGVEQDKLADIFKDVNDKFGEFLETGAGPLSDFFEQIAPAVGATASQFARLSGPEALQLYVDSLEKAGLPQERMTFYMEALASDATALLPLLRNNGQEMRRLGDEADRTGNILSDHAVEAGAALDDKLTQLADTLKTQMNQAILDNADDIIALTEVMLNEWIPALIEVAKFVGGVAAAIGNMVSEIGSAIGAIFDFAASVGDLENGVPEIIDSDSRLGRLRASGRRPAWEGLDSGYANEAFGPGNGPEVVTSPLGNPDLAPEQVEDIEEQRQDALDRLTAYREAREAIEQEADANRIAGASKTAEELLAIEERLQAAKVSAIAGAFGDISAVARTESEKLFKIGQLAAIAEATVNGGAAAVAAWKHGMSVGGPPVAAAFAGASLAKTGALISGIRSQSFSGGTGGSGGAGQGGSGQAGAPAVQERQVAEFRFTGGNVFDPQAIVDAINDAYDRGYVIRAASS